MGKAEGMAVVAAAALLICLLGSTNADTDPTDGQFFISLLLDFHYLDYVCMCIYAYLDHCVCLCV